MRILPPKLLRLVLLFGVLAAAAPILRAEEKWEAVHQRAYEKLIAVSQETFGSPRPPASFASGLPELNPESVAHPWMIVVGFTGGLQGKDNSASGVVLMRDGVGEHLGERQEVVALTFNNFRWRRAATEVLARVRTTARHCRECNPSVPQPLIVVYGHSWGAGSIAKFARALRKENIEISLAVYIDAFTLRNPRVPDNIRYAINFYQRSGIFRGLPLRGKSKLIPENREATLLLGNYRIQPMTERWGWSWNLLQPLLYRHHHRIAHDPRLRRYLLEVINLKLELLVQNLHTQAQNRDVFSDGGTCNAVALGPGAVQEIRQCEVANCELCAPNDQSPPSVLNGGGSGSMCVDRAHSARPMCRVFGW